MAVKKRPTCSDCSSCNVDYPPRCRNCHEKMQARMPLSGQSSRSYSQIKIERLQAEQEKATDAQLDRVERGEDDHEN